MATQSPLIVNDAHPSRDFDEITQLGLKVHNLALMYQADVEKRLPANTLAGLADDLGALGVAVPGVHQTRADARLATEVRDDAMARACRLLSAMRKVVRNARASKAVQHAYGVGCEIDPRRPPKVKSAVRTVLDRLAEHPEEAAVFGFLAEDLAALQAAHDEVGVTSETQHVKRAGAPQTTRERNRIANRILHAAQRITAAGCLAFVNDPEVYALFDAIRVTPPRRRIGKKADKPAPVQPAQAATPVLPG